jgi:TRAP-type C4-dicarboxylate transport system permease small subunit
MFTRLVEAGRIAEDAVLVVILTGMILLAASQIVLRNFLSIGFIWGDELLRMLVLWIAVAGAVAASRTDKHINIAILDRFLPEKPAQAVEVLIHLFTAVVCGMVTWFSIQFVRTTHEFGDLLLGGVPAWWLQMVLPVGFGLISYRYLLFAIKDVTGMFSSGSNR